MQYLNSMKCIWILTKIESSQSFWDAPSDSLWRTYVQGLETQLRREIDRFSLNVPESERLMEPPLDEVLALPEDSFCVLISEEPDDDAGPLTEKDLMDMVLNFEMPTADERTHHQLFVLRTSADTLKVKESITKRTRTMTKQVLQEHAINLDRVQLVPLYATPDAALDALNLLKFKGEGSPGSDVILSFKKLKDLMKVQHAITGYYVAKDKIRIRTESFYHQPMSLTGGTRICEEGRVQIWVPKILEKPSSHQSIPNQNGTISRVSPTGTPPAAATLQSLSLYAAQSSSVMSAVPALTRASTSETPPGLGHLHNKPKRPMLFFFLKDPSKTGADGEQYHSFLTVKIDQQTFVNRQSCECRKSKGSCLESSAENSSGALEGSRFSAGRDLDTWNVAAPGLW